jgi:hypothetical protein
MSDELAFVSVIGGLIVGALGVIATVVVARWTRQDREKDRAARVEERGTEDFARAKRSRH